MGVAVACWKGRNNVSILITKAEANQMHQRLSFADDPVSGPHETAGAIGAESPSTRSNDATIVDTGSDLKESPNDDQFVADSIIEEPQNGTIPSKADQLVAEAREQTKVTLVSGNVAENTA